MPRDGLHHTDRRRHHIRRIASGSRRRGYREYTLVLNYDDDGDGGDYKLTERYIGKADAVFVSEGDFSLHSSTPQDAAQRYLKLVPDHADRAADQATSSAEVRYFLVDSDSTLTLVGADLQRPDSLLNYTLTRK